MAAGGSILAQGVDGYVKVVTSTGVCAKDTSADFQLHIEFASRKLYRAFQIVARGVGRATALRDISHARLKSSRDEKLKRL
jgi:hypothetical protein